MLTIATCVGHIDVGSISSAKYLAVEHTHIAVSGIFLLTSVGPGADKDARGKGRMKRKIAKNKGKRLRRSKQ